MLMSPSPIRHFLPLVALFGLSQAAWAALEPATPANSQLDPGQVEFFEKSIRPVLADKCYKCHSAEATKVKGGLLLDTRDGIRNGGDTGPAVVPGNAKESLLLKAIHWQDKDLRMPPEKDGGKLPDDVIADFEKWIAMGAPDPRGAGTKVAKKEMDLTKAKELWTFQTPKAAPVPVVKDKAWPKSDVDRFLLAAQEASELHPVADADRPTLLRRVYFDLIGLPPTPAQLEAFVKDKSPNALARVVDSLLASPQFGERWGRHWLDTARFAESTGKERNFTFPEAWRYRDWVIGAVNEDKPYNQFIIEQIAGDLLPAKDAAERDQHISGHRIPGRRSEGAEREEQGDLPHGSGGRPDRHDLARGARADGGLRPLPRSQIRSNPDQGLLCAGGDFSQHRDLLRHRRRMRRRGQESERFESHCADPATATPRNGLAAAPAAPAAPAPTPAPGRRLQAASARGRGPATIASLPRSPMIQPGRAVSPAFLRRSKRRCWRALARRNMRSLRRPLQFRLAP